MLPHMKPVMLWFTVIAGVVIIEAYAYLQKGLYRDVNSIQGKITTSNYRFII
jgi:hypothetical protein